MAATELFFRRHHNPHSAITNPQSPQIAYKPRKYPETTKHHNRTEKTAVNASKHATKRFGNQSTIPIPQSEIHENAQKSL